MGFSPALSYPVSDAAKDRTALLLQTTTTLMRPLARLLVKQGVTYTLFAKAMKRVFLDAAQDELQSEGKRITDSALSLLSGVHRKDVRVLTSDAPPPQRKSTIASQVTYAWISQPEYLDADGKPRRLPMRSADDAEPSFDRLSQGISKDFHARSVLDEMVRLGVVAVEDGTARLVLDEGFLPAHDLHEVARYFAANLGDHMAASAANFSAASKGARTPYMEQALWGDELSAESVAELQRLAQQKWMTAMKSIRNLAEQRSAEDLARQPTGALHRFRFGAFFYHQPGLDPYVDPPSGATGDAPSPTDVQGKNS